MERGEIRPIVREDLPACLEIFHRGYETVAREFGLTEQNCPDRGRASLPMEKLTAMYEEGDDLFGYCADGRLAGLLHARREDAGLYTLGDLVVLPEYRGRGIGSALLQFCLDRARTAGARAVRLGMIDDNAPLKAWYEKNGFHTIDRKRYPGAPFTVGRMEHHL